MILMFSHYANRHKGICLHFEIDEDDSFAEVAPFNGREVEYKDTIPPFKDSSQAHMTLLTKYKKWEYEKEYRVLMGGTSDEDRIKKYKLGQLRGAIFGMHMTSSDENLVRCWFKKGGHKTPFFKKAQLSVDGFALQYVDV
jgi:hypothetical protein